MRDSDPVRRAGAPAGPTQKRRPRSPLREIRSCGRGGRRKGPRRCACSGRLPALARREPQSGIKLACCVGRARGVGHASVEFCRPDRVARLPLGGQSATALAQAAHFPAAIRGCANQPNDPRGVARAADDVRETVGAAAHAQAAHFPAAIRGCANQSNDPRGVARAANLVCRGVVSLIAPGKIGGEGERDSQRNEGREG